ncbi:hypothetical protein [Pseudonocardia sp. DLS-67]
MNEDMAGAGSGPLFFPATTRTTTTTLGRQELSPPDDDQGAGGLHPGPASIQLDPATVCAMSEAEIREQVLEMLACLKQRPMAEVAAGDAHTDGTLAIGSMIAVWVLSTVGKAFGRRLVRLSDVDRESLRSVGGVSRLIKQATARPAAAGAA